MGEDVTLYFASSRVLFGFQSTSLPPLPPLPPQLPPQPPPTWLSEATELTFCEEENKSTKADSGEASNLSTDKVHDSAQSLIWR